MGFSSAAPGPSPGPPAGPPPRRAPGPASNPASNPAIRIVVGLVLVVPALIALIVGHIGPTIWTWQTAFQKVDAVGKRPPEDVGTANFEQILGRGGLVEHATYALSFAILPLLTLLIVAPVLAYVANRAGRAGRWTARLALTVPMVAFVPVAIAAGTLLRDASDRLETRTASPLFNPGTAPMTMLVALGFAVGALVLGWAATAYLAAFRRIAGADEVWPAVLAVAGIGGLAVIAAALQVFAFPYVLTHGGPAKSTMTPMLDAYTSGFAGSTFGPAAAGSTVVLVILMALGVAATVIVLLTRIRIEVGPARAVDEVTGWSGGRVAALVVTIAGSLVALAVGLEQLRIAGTPWASPELQAQTLAPPPDVFVNTWGPTFLSTVIGVGLAAVAGFGIGALRPLGRFSELLLLPFAPWLFVGIGPLVFAYFTSAREHEQLNTLGGLMPPVWTVVPALFVCTLLFRGLREEPLSRAVVSALPMIGLVGLATWVVQAQDLLWPLVAAADKEFFTGPVAVALLTGQTGAVAGSPLGLTMPVLMLAGLAIVLGVAHVFYLDRLTIRTGRE